jgi:holo-[acyl-carrier-protein] synthase
LTKFFSENERTYFALKQYNPINIAGFFAAKEAAVKARGGTIAQYEIVHNGNGKPYVEYGGYSMQLSIAHEEEFAIAFVVYESEG